MQKIIKLETENTPLERWTENSACEIYSHDTNNGQFEIEVMNEALTDETVTALFIFEESQSVWRTTGTIEENKIKFKFDTTLITQDETVVCVLYLDNERENNDFYRFSFKVKVSEIDKLDNLTIKERLFKNNLIIDRLEVVTKNELKEALKNLDLSSISTEGLLTEEKANGLYAKISELEAVESKLITQEQLTSTKNEVVTEINNRLENYALKTNIPEPYNDTSLVSRVSDLEQKQDKDTIYNDEPIKERLIALENGNFATKDELKEIKNSQPTVDTSNFVTNQVLESKNYITEETLNNKGFAKASEIPAPYNDTALSNRVTALENKQDNDTVYNDTPIKERLKALESKSNIDLTDYETFKNMVVTKGYLEKQKFLTEPYNDKPLTDRVIALENKPTTNQFEIHGTGMPNGVVTADIGTTYVDENKTNGALKWIKTTNGGNTGWQVFTGDTGWRTLPLVNKRGNARLQIRRINDEVIVKFDGLSWVWFGVDDLDKQAGNIVEKTIGGKKYTWIKLNIGQGNNVLPVGFRSASSLLSGLYGDLGDLLGSVYVGGTSDSNAIQLRYAMSRNELTSNILSQIRISPVTFITDDDWPVQLP